MNVINLATSSLIIRDNHLKISTDTYNLACSNLGIDLIIFVTGLFPFMGHTYNLPFPLFICFLINIAYSSLVIDYYSNNKQIDDAIYYFSIVNIIIILLSYVLIFRSKNEIIKQDLHKWIN